MWHDVQNMMMAPRGSDKTRNGMEWNNQGTRKVEITVVHRL